MHHTRPCDGHRVTVAAPPPHRRHAEGVNVPSESPAASGLLRCAPPATSPTKAWPRRPSSPCGWAGPLFCEGEPGTGKTALAQALAQVLDAELIRLQCHDGIDAAQALYDWDFPRQLLHLRALEAAAAGDRLDVDAVEHSLYDERVPAGPPDPAGAADFAVACC